MIQYRNDEIRIERGIKTWLKIDSPKREKSARTNVIHGSLMKTRSTRVDSPSRIIKRRVLLKNTLFFSTIDHPIESIEFTFEREEEIVESAKIENLGRSRELPSPSMNKKKRKGGGGGKKTFFSRVEKKGINMKSGGAGERESRQ